MSLPARPSGTRIHPGVILAALDLVGLAIAGYLSAVALAGALPVCGPLKGCEEVAQSAYARIGAIPVAVLGVGLSLTLLVLAIGWTRSSRPVLLAAHYGLSLLGVVFELYFTYVELFILGAVCVWCAAYGVSLVARFLVALRVWARREEFDPERQGERLSRAASLHGGEPGQTALIPDDPSPCRS